jgi:hypothetical protein
MSVSSTAIFRTLVFHVIFFAALGSLELMAPDIACRDGLSGPLTLTGISISEMCTGLLTNPVGRLILFGLAKYHLFFCLISVIAAFGLNNISLSARVTVQQAVLVLHALNYTADITWAGFHISWIAAGPLALVPQGLLVFWDLHCGLAAI